MEYHGQQQSFVADVKLGSGGMAEIYHAVSQDDPDLHVASIARR